MAPAAPAVAAAVPQFLVAQATAAGTRWGSKEGEQQAPPRGYQACLHPCTARAASSGATQPSADGGVHFADDLEVGAPATAADAGPEHTGLPAATASGDGGSHQLWAGRTNDAARDTSLNFGDLAPETISL